MEVKSPFYCGYVEAENGRSFGENPFSYHRNHSAWRAWSDGWLSFQWSLT